MGARELTDRGPAGTPFLAPPAAAPGYPSWRAVLFSFVLAACSTEPTDSGADTSASGPNPWDDLHTELDPFHELLSVEVGTSGAVRLVPVAQIPAMAAWSPGGSGLALLDARYRVAETYSCLDPANFPDAVDGANRQGRCAAGLVELDRTHLALTEPVLDVADDPTGHRLTVLLRDGRIRVTETNLLTGNAWDWLRLGPVMGLWATDGSVPGAIAAADDGGWWGVAGGALVNWDGDGAVLHEAPLDGAGVAVVRSGPRVWAATATSVLNDHQFNVEVTEAAALVGDGIDGVWASSVAEGRLLHVTTTGVSERLPVEGLRGPFARDARTGKLYVLTADAVVVLQDGAEIARYPFDGPAAVAVNDSSEVSVLGADGTLHVYVDESAFGDAPPLSVWVATFVENPQHVASAVVCAGAEDAMEERMDRATANRDFLHDVPATVALAISPAAAAHATRCKVSDELAGLFDSPRLDPGVLFHDPPDCTDQSCLDRSVADDLGELTHIGIDPTWISGAAGWETGTGDWVKALVALDMPAVHGFVGLSALPEISLDDPRAKDALPWAGEAEESPWHAASAATAGEDAGSGGLLLLPGSTQAAFNFGACAGVLQAECHPLSLGGGDTFHADDTAVADLLLHRAAMHRGQAGGDTWYFHLPAIETYAYTEGCTVSGRAWVGDDCQAEYLQEWLYDVQSRLVTNGVVRWGKPSEVE